MKFRSRKLICICIITLIFLSACSSLKKSNSLTVNTIHDKIIFGKTTTSELKDMFGKESKYIESKKAQKIYHYWNNYEGGVNYMLEDNTDYWETLKTNPETKGTISYEDFDGCYEYRGDRLGVKSVYFFVIDNKVYDMKFNGDITNESIAKKDKYLRKIFE